MKVFVFLGLGRYGTDHYFSPKFAVAAVFGGGLLYHRVLLALALWLNCEVIHIHCYDEPGLMSISSYSTRHVLEPRYQQQYLKSRLYKS
ncbi:MAG: hypothetical protein WBF90_08800 [Rivularia sp. (in: cyanobacteria)]